MIDLKILLTTIVRPFYKENAGLLLFVFIIMFSIVNKVDGAGVLQYHYVLINAFFDSMIIQIIVFLIWLVYTIRANIFIIRLLQSPQYKFMHIYNLKYKYFRFRLFGSVNAFTLLPIMLYALIMICVGV